MSGLIYSIFITLLIFAPLAFGTVEPWSFAVLECFSFLALVLCVVEKRREAEPLLYEVPGLFPLTLFLAYILFQLVPLPAGLLRVVSSGTYALYKETLWAADPNAWGSLSVNRNATLAEFFRLAAYAAFYILTIQVLARKDLLKRTVWILVVFVSVLASFSMLQHFLWNNKIYWLREVPVGAHPFGPYVNRNNYAGLLDMILPLIVCLFIYYRPRNSCRSLRAKAVEAFSNPLTNVHVLLGFFALLVATSVFRSLSKGGIISLCISMIFLAGIIRNKGKEAKGWLLVALIVTLAFYSVGWFGWNQIFKRFEALRDTQGAIAEARMGIWKDSVAMIRDFPLTGTGFGSYIHIYPKYRSITAEEIVDHAHNDYMELLSEGGFVAVVIFLCFLYSVVRKSYKAFRGRRERYCVLLYIGAATGIVSILIYSITDFNLHIGANGLYFFFLVALLVSAANTRIQDGLNGTLLRKTMPVTNMAIIPAVALLLFIAALNTGGLVAKFGLSSLRAESLDSHTRAGDLQTTRVVASRAAFLDPLNAEPHYAAASADWLLSDKAGAADEYKKAVRRDPLNGQYLQSLGLAMSKLGSSDKADSLLRSGISCDGSNPLRYRTYASWLISSGKSKDGAQYMRKAISLEPKKTRDYVALLVLRGFRDEDIRDALPEMAEPHLLFADYLHQTGNDSMAASEYYSAIGYLKNEKKVMSSYFYQASQYFMKSGLFDDALTVMRKAEEALPVDVEIKMTLAEMYEKARMPYRAAEEYRKVLLVDPENGSAKKKLQEIK
ncbi:MAG TPA: hypothetical protein DCP92_20380 [Nitrospiraceae bacterium]|nr:hypothetical protein [Nitrospiraceae bacterium]